MSYKQLFILIEGDDDKLLFERIITPLFASRYDFVALVKHARMPKSKLKSFLRNIARMQADYIYARDLNAAPCVTKRKESLRERIPQIEHDRIAVVVKAIEAWYVAGLDSKACKRLGIPCLRSTDATTKEQFARSTPRRFASSRVDYMQEILKHFSTDVAKRKNASFKYFLERHVGA